MNESTAEQDMTRTGRAANKRRILEYRTSLGGTKRTGDKTRVLECGTSPEGIHVHNVGGGVGRLNWNKTAEQDTARTGRAGNKTRVLECGTSSGGTNVHSVGGGVGGRIGTKQQNKTRRELEQPVTRQGY
ncbi:hypothetical protein J6590_006800 [Homalodisca vitripennis]|nr:hypothetical protein J6590_006800 [Homalodisca vitripennis]